MSLAARCTACGTVFRVVQDQLRVSEGWVRCGRCGEIFNAIENFVDVDVDANLERPAPEAAVMPAWNGEDGPGDGGAPARIEVVEPAQSGQPDGAGVLSAVVVALGGDDATVSKGATEATASTTARAGGEPVSTGTVSPIAPDHAPRFVRRADRAARWQRPRVRVALWATGGLLVGALVLQILLEFRALIAARWTPLRPLLEAACNVAGCILGPARWIEALAVDSSGLVRIDGTGLYRVSVALKNRSDVAVAMPALDLSLTDGQGGLMARRVIVADEIGVRQQSLDAHAGLMLQATLAAADRPVAGYTIEIFYP